MAYQHTATSNGVYEQLKEQILHLELPPGSTISEIDTGEKYHISRTPVRDAFKRLELDGLLEIRAHIGTFISLIDMNAVSDILYAREVLEYAVLSELSDNYDDSHDLAIRDILQKQEALLSCDMEIDKLSRAFIQLDNEFHCMLFEAAGKGNIPHFLSAVNSQYERFRTFVNYNGKDDIRKLYEAHKNIWEHIVSHNLDALKDTLHHHLYDGFDSSAEIIGNFPEYFK